MSVPPTISRKAVFRGVTQQKVADSIQAGLDFLRTLDLDGEGQEHLQAIEERIAERDMVGQLRMIDSHQSLSWAIDIFKAETLFAPLAETLEKHAELDTNGKGKQVRDDLAQWGAHKPPVKEEKLPTTQVAKASGSMVVSEKAQAAAARPL